MDGVKRFLANPLGWTLFLLAELFLSFRALDLLIPAGASRTVVTVVFVAWAVVLFVLNYRLRRHLSSLDGSSGRR